MNDEINQYSIHSELSPPNGDCYRRKGLERPVLDRDLSGNIAEGSYKSWGLNESGPGKDCAGERAFGGYSREL